MREIQYHANYRPMHGSNHRGFEIYRINKNGFKEVQMWKLGGLTNAMKKDGWKESPKKRYKNN